MLKSSQTNLTVAMIDHRFIEACDYIFFGLRRAYTCIKELCSNALRLTSLGQTLIAVPTTSTAIPDARRGISAARRRFKQILKQFFCIWRLKGNE